MYAIIRAGGHQEKVMAGEQITLNRVKEEAGEEIRFVPVLVSTDEGTVVTDRDDLEARAAVVARVVEHTRGEKVRSFQYRAKTNYRRHVGHRQPISVLEITEIRYGDQVVTGEAAREAAEAAGEAAEAARVKAVEEREKARREAREKKEAKKQARTAAAGGAAGEKKPGAKKTAAKKPAAKKPAAKKPAAKKPAAKKPAAKEPAAKEPAAKKTSGKASDAAEEEKG